MQNQRDQDIQQAALQSTHLERMTPKYCTSIQVGLLSAGNLVLSLIYSEPNQPNLLIERVIIDKDHADNLANVLKTAVAEAQKKDMPTLH